jgi:ABC-type transport system involved in multi-copper enzyme maturation permease subunit
VYVASAIAEEKENRTLEIVFLSFLTDRELVLGKLWARLLHLGAIVLGGFPLLVFMHLWGNVDIAFLLYHEANTFLLLFAGGSICIWMSTQSEGAFQAITRSYPWLALLGFVGVLAGFVFPWFIGEIMAALGAGGRGIPWYFTSIWFLYPVYLILAWVLLRATITLMRKVRREEKRRPKKITGAFALADKPVPRPQPSRRRVPGRRRRAVVSNIHPLALPIRGSALFWKECLKDGTSWSLRARWLIVGLLAILVPIYCYRLLGLHIDEIHRSGFGAVAYSFTYTAYFLCLAAYALVVVFQTTLSVAGEREQDTLVFLQLIPESTRAILFFKWLGPLWRNWPILAIGYLGVLLGMGCGLYSVRTALFMCLLPWPFLLMLSFLALCLSVLCRRVLFANIGLVGFLLVLFIGHIVAAGHIGVVFPFYLALLFETHLRDLTNFPWMFALVMACCQQCAFLALASLCGCLAFWRFQKRDYAFS